MYTLGSCIVYLLHAVATFLMCRSKFSKKKTIIICGCEAAVQILVLLLVSGRVSDSPEWIYSSFWMATVFLLACAIIISVEPIYQTLFVVLTYGQLFLIFVFVSGLLSNWLFGGSNLAAMWIRTLMHSICILLYAVFFKKRFDKVRQDVTDGWGSMCLLAILYSIYMSYISITARANSFEKVDLFHFILLFLIILTGYGVIFHTIYYMREVAIDSQVKQHQKILLQKLEIMQEAEEEARRIRHDTRHHLLNIAKYAKNGENDKLLRYLGEYTQIVEQAEVCHVCENTLIDHILTVYDQRAKQNGIMTEYNIDVKGEIGIREVDMVAILSDLMENAIHGCLDSKKEKTYIKVRIKSIAKRFSISVKNTCREELRTENGLLRSEAKKGIGISSIVKSVNKYGGDIDFKAGQGVFVCRIIMKQT